MAENIGSPLRISDIAARFFVSGNKLSKDFRAFTPIPVHQFIVHVKISIAQYELKRDDQSVREVARRMGFENDIYFFSFFRKNTGMTPLQWKKAIKDRRNIRKRSPDDCQDSADCYGTDAFVLLSGRT